VVLDAMANSRYELPADGTWQTVRLLDMAVRDIFVAGEDGVAPLHTLDLEFHVKDVALKAKEVVQRSSDGSAVLVTETVRGLAFATHTPLLLQARHAAESNVVGFTVFALPSPGVEGKGVGVETPVFVGDECVLCLEAMAGEVAIIGCGEGHVVCGRCGEKAVAKLERCPLCRGGLRGGKAETVKLARSVL
tara:strand:- start:216 stop:788 length:573 start_codon:yes stop_codon:yes gene_type:complete